ncbi:MAG: helix-turn-helix transcriptional regulator [Pseudomonadota bacterium]
MEPIEIREFRGRIGRAIRKLREEEGISASFLAKVLGVTQPTISRIEHGTTSISAEKLCFLAKSFNKPLSYFVGEQSPILHDEEDILRAGAVFYGARHLKSKIGIPGRVKSYAEYLEGALKEVSDPRFAAALATTLYNQAAQDNAGATQILSRVQNEWLLANLEVLIRTTLDAIPLIKRPSREKKRAEKNIQKLLDEFQGRYKDKISASASFAKVDPSYAAEFINASIGYEE